MKIKPDLYPVIIILTLVIFTILGMALGFVPTHHREEHNMILRAILT
jgi:hypothetical protein